MVLQRLTANKYGRRVINKNHRARSVYDSKILFYKRHLKKSRHTTFVSHQHGFENFRGRCQHKLGLLVQLAGPRYKT
jgi:hypothetical protein